MAKPAGSYFLKSDFQQGSKPIIQADTLLTVTISPFTAGKNIAVYMNQNYEIPSELLETLTEYTQRKKMEAYMSKTGIGGRRRSRRHRSKRRGTKRTRRHK